MSLLSKPELLKLAVEIAGEYDLDSALICAHIDVRTHWDSGFAVSSAISYLVRQSFPDPMESEHRATMWGLMAIQGEFARNEGYQDDLSGLLAPARNLEVGCSFFQRLLRSKPDPVEAAVYALCSWNSENNQEMARQTLGKIESYRELLARIDDSPRAFLRDGNSHLPEYSQISDNPLLEVGATTHTRTRP
jgi:hypothetical protein